MLLPHAMLRPAAILALCALFASVLLAVLESSTREQAAENERQALLQQLSAVLPADRFDNELLQDVIYVHAPMWLGTAEKLPVYRARWQGRDAAAVIAAEAADGYNGRIRFLVAIDPEGMVLAVRVVLHHETPGLGDGIEARKSSWIEIFSGHSLDNPEPAQWALKRDGGVFDQLTGASITPRAVIKALRRCLEFFQLHQERLFASPAGSVQEWL